MILILIASLQRMRNSSREIQWALVISIFFGVKHLFTLNEARTLLFIKPGNSLKKKSNKASFV